MNGLEHKIVWGLVLGVALYGGLAIWSDGRAVQAVLGALDAGTVGMVLLLVCTNYALRFLKWQYLLWRVQVVVPVGASALAFVAGMVMSITPGKLGEVLKGYLLRRSHGVAVEETAGVVLVERLTDLLALMVLASWGVAHVGFGRTPFLVCVVAVVGATLAVQSERLVGGVLTRLNRVSALSGVVPRLDQAWRATRRMLAWRSLATAIALSLVGWSMEVWAFAWIVEALGALRADLWSVAFAYALTTVLGALSLMPGGLGVTEGSLVGALLYLGVFAERAPAVAATLVLRLSTLWFGVALGLVALIAFRMRYFKSDRP